MAPLVSVVIPCYRGIAYLSQAIESCLAQTYSPIEIIVVDDASPDRCGAIAEEFSTRYLQVRSVRHQQNGGVSRAFNTGYSLARGTYLTRLAQDDVFRSDAIQLMVELLESRPEIGLAYCDCVMTDESLNPIKIWKTGSPDTALQEDNDLGLCVMWRREVWDAVGGFDSDFDTAEDYEYWLRVNKRFAFGKCGDEAPFYLRLHDSMGSFNWSIRQRFAVTRAKCRHLLPREDHARAWAETCREASWICRSRGEFQQAWIYARCALSLHPASGVSWKVLAGATARYLSAAATGKVATPRERFPEWLVSTRDQFA